ncbi:GNAT family N-acetyltransferase [Bremerella sp. JC817]|uniref:GNAT family N-acetyltransferase n=1 Tax=Bremerella sp. JC817 TaxID=3231756 RepID=UPI00345A724D
MAKVIEVNRIEDLRAYDYHWDRLVQQTPNATFFQTLPWLQTYWQFFGFGKKLRVLLIQIHGRIEGILPLVEQPETTKAGRVTVLTYPLDGWGPFFGPIGSEPTATLYLAMQYLSVIPRTWDMLDLRWIDPRADRGRASNAMRCHGLASMTLPWNPTYVIQLPETFDQYLATRSPKFRASIRRTLRRMDEENVVAARYRPEQQPGNPIVPDEKLYDTCVALARASWQGGSTTGTTISHDSTAAYFRECFFQASKLGMIDLTTLRHENRLIAFSYNFHHQGNVLGLRMGYQGDCKRLSPGTMMMAYQIRDSIERGDTLLDLGPEHAEIKARWINQTLPSQRVCHYSSASLLATILRLGHWWKYRTVAG